jgi:hypothetical protein
MVIQRSESKHIRQRYDGELEFEDRTALGFSTRVLPMHNCATQQEQGHTESRDRKDATVYIHDKIVTVHTVLRS